MAARKRKAAEAAPAPIPAPPAPPAFGEFRLEQLGFCQCRFPTSPDGQPFRFCGQRTGFRKDGQPASWCEEHGAIVFVPWQRGGSVVRKAEAA